MQQARRRGAGRPAGRSRQQPPPAGCGSRGGGERGGTAPRRPAGGTRRAAAARGAALRREVLSCTARGVRPEGLQESGGVPGGRAAPGDRKWGEERGRRTSGRLRLSSVPTASISMSRVSFSVSGFEAYAR